MSTVPAVQITDQQKQQYQDEGYFILEAALPDEVLQALREETDRLVQRIHDEMVQEGVEIKGRNQLHKRYFVGATYKKSEVFARYIASDIMAEICRQLLGDEAQIFANQLAVKGTEPGGAFSWHQDSGYVGYEHPPYVTTWTAFDDVDESNGTVYVLPFSRYPESREIIPHVKDETINDKIGYWGDDPGEPVIAPAGSIAVFSSRCFHRSGPNQSDRPRRALVAQYTREPLMKPDGSGPQGMNIPFLQQGQRVI